jgi:dolichyl-phosphate-mannose-protein mannosyltransferase
VLRRKTVLLWAAILALALALRLPSVWAGLPYSNYIDEGHLLHRVGRLIRTGSWDPRWYLYPSLPLYAVAAAVSLYSPVYAAVHGRPLAGDLSAFPFRYYDVVEPAEVFVLGRVVTLGFSLGIVLLTGLLARRLAGEAAGLFAALLAALLPALVIRGAAVTVDPYATFFALAAIYFAEGAVRKERPWRDSILAGLMIGCALTSKYPSVLVTLAVVPTLLRIAGDWRRKVRAVELAALAAMVAAAVTMPALVLKNREVLTDLVRQSMVYEGASMGSYWEQAVRRAEWDQPLDAPEVGLPFLVCVLLGWVTALTDRRYAGTAAAWTLFAAALAIVLSRYPFRPFRNLLPLLPLACVLVALLFARARERLRWRVWGDAAGVALVLVLFLPSSIAFARERAGMVDARVRALDWVAEHAGAADVVLVSEELAILRGELARLRAQTEVLDLRQARVRLRRRRDVQFVVTGDLGGRGGLGLPDVIAKRKTRAPFELAARFGENPSTRIWRGNRQLVLVFRRGDG